MTRLELAQLEKIYGNTPAMLFNLEIAVKKENATYTQVMHALDISLRQAYRLVNYIRQN